MIPSPWVRSHRFTFRGVFATVNYFLTLALRATLSNSRLCILHEPVRRTRL